MVTSVFIADSKPLVRLGMKTIIATNDIFDVIGESGEFTDIIKRVSVSLPDILILDMDINGGGGEDLFRLVNEKLPTTKVLLSALDINTEQVAKCFGLGARGAISWLASEGVLLGALIALSRGNYWLENTQHGSHVAIWEAMAPFMPAVRNQKRFNLTPREIEIIRSITEASTNKDIAHQFVISEETVKRHLANIFDKTGVSTRLELAIFAIYHRVVDSDIRIKGVS